MSSVVWAVGAGATHATASECRASTIRVVGPGIGTVEPFVASGPAGCTLQNAGVLNPALAIPGGLGSLRLLYASTDPGGDPAPAPSAEAGVADLNLTLPGAPPIRAQVLTSEARVACTGQTPSVVGSSNVLKLTVGTTVVEIPPGGARQEIEVPGVVRVVANERPAGVGTGEGPANTYQALVVQVIPAGIEVVVAESTVTPGADACKPHTTTTTTPPTTTAPPTTAPPTAAPIVGWMNGGGQLNAELTHSFILPCTTTQKRPGPNLQVETPTGRFKLTQLLTASCGTEAGGGPEDPRAGFNTLRATGKGTCSGQPADITVRFTDEGEENQGRDKATITITNSPRCNGAYSGTVNGNHQAHRAQNPPA